jgi:hypothetical protein
MDHDLGAEDGARMDARSRAVVQWTLVVVVVVGLAIDAYVHFDLADAFKNNKTSTLSEADMFRAEATVAIVAAAALLLRPRRYTAAFAFVVAGAGFVAVVVTRYVDVGVIGPFPDTYDPFWEPTGKWLSAIGEAAAALAALGLFAILQTGRRAAPSPRTPASAG